MGYKYLSTPVLLTLEHWNISRGSLLQNPFRNVNHVVQLWYYGALGIQLLKHFMMRTDQVKEECSEVRGDNWCKHIVHDCHKS